MVFHVTKSVAFFLLLRRSGRVIMLQKYRPLIIAVCLLAAQLIILAM